MVTIGVDKRCGLTRKKKRPGMSQRAGPRSGQLTHYLPLIHGDTHTHTNMHMDLYA